MKMSVIELIKLGQKYLKLWPEKPELGHYFADYKSVQASRFVCKYFPALALFTVIMQLYIASGLVMGRGSVEAALAALPQALFYGLFLLTMPVQALVISGVKADKLLPPSLASWYRSGIEKAKQQGQTEGEQKFNRQALESISKLAVYKPRYIDLAKLLQITFYTTSIQNQRDR